MPVKARLFLLSQLVRRDLASRYRGSLLGGLWAFAVPLIMLAVYTFVFSVVFQARWGSDGSSQTAFALNLFVGIILHGLLAESLSRAPAIMLQHASYVKKMVFPLWLLPVSVVLSALVFALVNWLVLLVAFVFLDSVPPVTVLALPLILLPLLLFALGGAWLLAALGVYVRDIVQVVPLLMTVLMFMAPIFYPASAIPEVYRGWLLLNPLTYAVEHARGLLFEQRLPGLAGYLCYLGVAVAVAVAGLWFFRRVRKGFADVL